MRRLVPLLAVLAACASPPKPSTPEEQVRDLRAYPEFGRAFRDVLQSDPTFQTLMEGLVDIVHRLEVDSAIRRMSSIAEEKRREGRLAEAEGWYRGVIWAMDDPQVWPPVEPQPEYWRPYRAEAHAGLARLASIRGDAAVGFLELGRALEWGYRNFDALETEPDFAFLRVRQDFRPLVDRYNK